MRTSLNEIRKLEEYVLKSCPADEKLIFDAKLIIDKDLRQNLYWQQKTYKYIQEYGRRKLKSELEDVHQKLFSEHKYTSFRERILKLFNK